MNNELFLKLGKSILITVIISAAFAFAFSAMVGSFLSWFALFFVVQFIVFYAIGEIYKIKKEKSLIEQDYKNKELLTWQSINVQCPCDKRMESTVPVKLNTDNIYQCPGCSKNIRVNIQSTTALMTNPINTEIIQSPIFADQLNQLLATKNGV